MIVFEVSCTIPGLRNLGGRSVQVLLFPSGFLRVGLGWAAGGAYVFADRVI